MSCARFARARCDDCGHDYFVAFSCKGRGVCPSCNTRRMVETPAQLDKAALHIGAIAFIHRFGSSLNGHVHFHVCVVDGVFEELADDADAASRTSPQGVIFHPASAIDAAAVAQVQADLRRRIHMLAYQHSGFSVDAGVCIEAHDRAALERLLRYCARPLPWIGCVNRPPTTVSISALIGDRHNRRF